MLTRVAAVLCLFAAPFARSGAAPPTEGSRNRPERLEWFRDLGFLHTAEELKPFLEGEIPSTVEQNARMCGTDVAGYVAEGPGLSVYALADGTVYMTYVSTARGLEPVMAYYALLDRTPRGRDEGGTRPLWVRRHDEYEQG
jgi:predicted dithiol-disulfide oxidoreductase (DUF899 family)